MNANFRMATLSLFSFFTIISFQNCSVADFKEAWASEATILEPDFPGTGSNGNSSSDPIDTQTIGSSSNGNARIDHLFFDPTASEKNSIEFIYYVDKNHEKASDDNDGTEDRPWKTIVHAAAYAQAGMTVLIKKGIYEDSEIVKILNSGTEKAWIKFKSFPGHERKVVIKSGGILSEGNSYILVEGLKILEAPGNGIRFVGPKKTSDPAVTHIIIRNNHTHKTCSSAISIWGVPWGKDPVEYDNIRNVVVEHNLLEYGTMGCKNEIVTVANGASNVLVRYNEITLGDPAYEGGDEGIDFKEGVVDSAIYGNYIHHLADKAIYLDGGSSDDFPHRDPQVRNIHIFNNLITDIPSAGIAIQTEGRGDVSDVMVYNNIVANVTGSGYRLYDHPGGVKDGGTVSRIYFYNNIAYQTGLENPFFDGLDTNDKATPKGGGFSSSDPGATDIVFVNNISWNNGRFDFKFENSSNNWSKNNICSESVCEIQDDPEFRNPNNLDFRLLSSSIAIDAGVKDSLTPDFDYDGNNRDSRPDIGVFEYTSESSEK